MRALTAPQERVLQIIKGGTRLVVFTGSVRGMATKVHFEGEKQGIPLSIYNALRPHLIKVDDVRSPSGCAVGRIYIHRLQPAAPLPYP